MDTTGRIGDKARRKTKGKAYLPDDIIPNILCRLPAKKASLVCKGRRDLILTRDFIDLHFRHNSHPTILVGSIPNVKHLLLDKWWEPARRKLLIHKVPTHSEYSLGFSYAGIVICRLHHNFIILNPINLEKVTISIPNIYSCRIHGVFFNSSLKEYCTLMEIELKDQPNSILYKMLSLGSKPLMKTISNPFPYRDMKGDSLVIDKYVYWMLVNKQKHDSKHSGLNDIMQFNIISEEFSVKHCPVPVDTECHHFHTHILNIDGALSFLVMFPSKITIWRLEGHAEQLWTTSNYNFSSENFKNMPTPIAVVGRSLALLSDGILLVCDLMQGTIKCFRKKKYHRKACFLSHQVSLASLRNCTSTIYLDEMGEVVVRENIMNSDRFGNWKKKKQELHNGFKANLEGEPSSREKMIERFADKGKGKAKEVCGQREEKGGLEEVETVELSDESSEDWSIFY